MPDTYSLTEARAHLDELVERARESQDRIVLTDAGTPAAIVLGIADFEDLLAARDEVDLRLAKSSRARGETGIEHDQFMAILEAENAD